MEEPNIYPPQLSLKLIHWLCRSELAEEIEGNLIEYFNALPPTSRFRMIKYWFQVFTYLRLSTVKNFKHSKHNSMFILNPLQSFRNLLKQGASTFINISGFTVGLTCVVMLYFYISSELSVDSFHKDGDQIYRTLRIGSMNGSPYDIGVTSPPFAPALLNDYPNSIKAVCRAYIERGLVAYEDQKFYEEGLLFADSNFFNFFSFPLKRGNPKTVLSNPNNIVLTQQMATKYFGAEDPIGKVLILDNDSEFIVSGVMAEPTSKSHLEFKMVINIEVLKNTGFYTAWWSNALSTYVKIENAEEALYVNSQLDNFMDKYFGEDFKRSGTRMGLKLERLSDIYFNKDTQYDSVAHGNLGNIYILGIVAAAILFIACFNYVNLAIAQSFKRAKEVAVRKVLGGEKIRLVAQMLGESLIILVIASLLSLAMVLLLKPAFSSLFQLDFKLKWDDPNVYIFFSTLILSTLLVAGAYPAILISSFDPNKIFRDKKLSLGKNSWLHKSLVIAQFIISIILIASTLIISKQMSFVRNTHLGFDRDALVVLEINNNAVKSNLKTFKERLEQSPHITSVTRMTGEPGGFHDATVIQFKGEQEVNRIRIGIGDEDYFSTFNIQIIAGRNFSKSLESEVNRTAIINETALKMLNLTEDEIFEKRFDLASWGFEDVQIVGVAKDYHFTSLKNKIEPLVIMNGESDWRCGIKVNGQNLNASLQAIAGIWEEMTPQFPLQYKFLDDSLNRLYETENRQGKVLTAFSGISIFLACLGVFGLVTHATKQRQKEFGIRKVLGAGIGQIFRLVSKEFVILLLVASIIAIPASWYLTSKWLQQFAFHIEVKQNWLLFVLSSFIAFVIAFLSIAMKTYKTAISNPVKSIRYE